MLLAVAAITERSVVAETSTTDALEEAAEQVDSIPVLRSTAAGLGSPDLLHLLVRDRALFRPSCGNLHVRHALVGDDPPVTHPDDPVAGGTNLLVVRDDEHGLPALTVEATEQAQDFRGPG